MGTTVKAPSPDPAIGQASGRAMDLAEEQYADQKALLAEYSPLYKQQIEFNLDQQTKNAGRSDQAWNDYQTTFRPLEQQMASEVAGYNTQGRRDQAANEAMGSVAGTFGTARQGLTESLAAQNAAGGGRGLALGNALNIEEAKAKAGAGNAARRNVESTGLSLLGSATNFGRGLTNSGLQTGQAAQASGQAAQGNVAGLSGLTSAGYGQALQGYGVGINGMLGQYQAQANSSAQQNGIFGDLLGAGMTAYGIYKSSKKLKNQGSPVSGKAALKGLSDLPVEGWAYKPGMGDGGEHVGPYAEDVNKRFGDRVAPGGKAINMAEMGDVNAKALRELAKELASVKQQIADMEAA